jgi:hypothetical protein
VPSSNSQPASANPFGTTAPLDYHVWATDGSVYLIQTIYDIETKRALDRHDNGEAKVIPILLRPVDWEGAPFTRLQGLPIDLRPVTTWTNKDEAFKNIAQDIRRAIEGMRNGTR